MLSAPSNSLKVYREEAEVSPLPPATSPEPGDLIQSAALDRLSAAIGWKLRLTHSQYAPPDLAAQSGPLVVPLPALGTMGDSRDTSSPPSLVIVASPLGEKHEPIDHTRAREVAAAAADLLADTQRWQIAACDQQAQRAVEQTPPPTSGESASLAGRLEAVLRGGGEAIGLSAAGLYVLDEATTELKLRCSWRLPPDRLLEPARALRTAAVDLEALTGRAVAIENAQHLPHWRLPERFASAVCVPVSSAAMPLGTLWGFGTSPRDFSPAQTELWEIIAGRIAAELEKESLLQRAGSQADLHAEMQSAGRWHAARLPQAAPLLDDWDLAGYAPLSGGPLAAVFDWCVLTDSTLAAHALAAGRKGVAGAMSAAAISALIAAHHEYRLDAAQLVSRVAATLWTASPGDEAASLAALRLDPENGRLQFAAAGRADGCLLAATGTRLLSGATTPLGGSADAVYQLELAQLAPGDLFILAAQPLSAASPRSVKQPLSSQLARVARKHRSQPAAIIVNRLQGAIEKAVPQVDRRPSVVVVKRNRE